MNGETWTSILNLLTSIWRAFDQATPLANAIGILVPLFGLFGSVRWYLHRRLKDKDGQIAELLKDRATRDKTIDDLRTRVTLLEARCAEAENQLPQKALAKAEAEWKEHNDLSANRALLEWFESEGRPVSQMLLRRAQWAVAHAAGDVRAMGLVLAQSFAIAAIAVDPKNDDAVILLEEVEEVLDEAAQPLPTLILALSEFEGRASDLFDPDLVTAAAAAEREARLQFNRGYYHLALPAAEQALVWLIKVAFVSERTLRACFGDKGVNTRYQVASLLSQKYPELGWRLPRPRKAWETEYRNMSIFDAAAMGLAYLESGSDEGKQP